MDSSETFRKFPKFIMYLTDGDMRILPLIAQGGFHHATRWYLSGWKPLPWQYAYFYARQLDQTALNGIATGKTMINAVSGLMKCISIPYYQKLNTSVTAKQAELPFEMIMNWYENDHEGRIKRHIKDIKLQPWAIIHFNAGGFYEFRTAGTDAKFIRGTEYDEIDYDEAGLDYHGESVNVLRGRLRGTRLDGTPRVARLNVCTSPTDAPWLRTRFMKGKRGEDNADLEHYYSYKIRTRDNTNLTEVQIVAMENQYTDEMRAVEMDAEFPDYGMSEFPKRHILACTDSLLNDRLVEAIIPEEGKPKKGYDMTEHPRYGLVKFEFPFEPNGRYILAGDPGTDDPPRRNAGCVMVVNINKKPAQLCYFDWVAGHGSYMPFVNSYEYAIKKFNPEVRLIDTTGTQKMMQELAFERFGIETDKFNFGQKKDGLINALSLNISNHEYTFPYIWGLDRQLSTFTRALANDKKHPQDIVMTLGMISYAMVEIPEVDNAKVITHSVSRRNRKHRGRRH